MISVSRINDATEHKAQNHRDDELNHESLGRLDCRQRQTKLLAIQELRRRHSYQQCIAQVAA